MANPVQEAFSKAAAGYEQHAELQRVVRQECLNTLSGLLPDRARVLDIGCGTGALFTESREAGLHWQITGLDLAFGMCAEAARAGTVVNAEAQALPFADGCFDGLFSSLMLQWADQPLQAFREMMRVL